MIWAVQGGRASTTAASNTTTNIAGFAFPVAFTNISSVTALANPVMTPANLFASITFNAYSNAAISVRNFTETAMVCTVTWAAIGW